MNVRPKASEEKQRQFFPAPTFLCRCNGSGTGRGIGRGDITDRQALGFRWITQAFIGASLIGDGQSEWAIVAGLARDIDVENAVIDLDVAEELIVLFLTRWQLRSAQADVGGLGMELEAMAIQVITFGGRRSAA